MLLGSIFSNSYWLVKPSGPNMKDFNIGSLTSQDCRSSLCIWDWLVWFHMAEVEKLLYIAALSWKKLKNISYISSDTRKGDWKKLYFLILLKYRCFYPHRLRGSVSPVCMVFNCTLHNTPICKWVYKCKLMLLVQSWQIHIDLSSLQEQTSRISRLAVWRVKIVDHHGAFEIG